MIELMNLLKNIVLLGCVVLGISACKKSTTSPQQDTFIKVFPEPTLAFNAGPNSFQSNTGDIVTDNAGNCYCWYYQKNTAVGGWATKLAILKTDSKGNQVWNRVYGSFHVASYQWNRRLVNSGNFICDGQSLYIAGTDTAGTPSLLKFNTDGDLLFKTPLDLLPNGQPLHTINNLWPLSNGNFIVNGTYTRTIGPVKGEDGGSVPFLAMISPSGGVLWQDNDLPFPLQDSTADYATIEGMAEMPDGSMIFSGTGYYSTDNTSLSGTLATYINVYKLTADGQLQYSRSTYGGQYIESRGTSVTYALVTDYDLQFSQVLLLPSGNPLLIMAILQNNSGDFSIRLTKLDASSGSAVDSSDINTGEGLYLRKAINRSDGNVMINAYTNFNTTTRSKLFTVGSDLSLVNTGTFSFPNESIYTSGLSLAGNDHYVLAGTIQSFGKDSSNLLMIKTNGNAQY